MINSLICLIVLFLVTTVHGKTLGTFGQTFPIIEQDFLEFIEERLKQLEASGKLAAMQEQLATETKKHVDRPKSVSITKAQINRTWLFDPTFTAKSDVIVRSKVLIKAGTKVNPLDLVTPNPMVFYDADDKKQVAWAKSIDAKFSGREKLVLVNGSVFSQVKFFRKAIYFDQSGKLTRHFKIQHVPAIVEANNRLLKISEVKL